jgi:hypothetical protein
MEPKFYLYQRKNGIFYAELIIEGKRIVRSTKETTRNKAAIAACRYAIEDSDEPMALDNDARRFFYGSRQ